jgi:hypothetical protein
MKNLAAAVVAACVVLMAATPGLAKEPLRATVCGASGCKTITDRRTLEQIPGGESTVALGAVAPFYRLTIVIGEPDGARHRFRLYYVPSANAMAFAEDGSVRFHPIYGREAAAVMKRVTAGLRPFRRPHVTAVTVGKRRLSGTAARTYLSLFSAGEESRTFRAPSDWIPIDLRSPRGSPWTDGAPDLVYAASDDLIERGWRRFEVSPEIAADIEAARALAAGDESSSRVLLGAGIGGGALLLGFGLLAARRGRG